MSERSMVDHFNAHFCLLLAIDAVLEPEIDPHDPFDCLEDAAGRARLTLARAVADYDLVPALEGPLRAWRDAYARASESDDPDYVAALEGLRTARAAMYEVKP